MNRKELEKEFDDIIGSAILQRPQNLEDAVKAQENAKSFIFEKAIPDVIISEEVNQLRLDFVSPAISLRINCVIHWQ